MDEDVAGLMALAEQVARAAGELLMRLRDTPLTPTRKSSASDWVTRADRDAEALITAKLLAERPHDGVMGEEGGGRESVSGYTWVVDPLDGTTNYMRGYPGWCVSVAVCGSDGRTVAGAVHEPATATTWTASVDDVSRRDGRPVQVSTPRSTEELLVGTGFSYSGAERTRQAAQLRQVLPAVADLRRGGSAALELCRVADGALDAFAESDLEVWDWAAGGLIVERAGGRCEPWSPSRGADGVVAGSHRALDLLQSLLDSSPRLAAYQLK